LLWAEKDWKMVVDAFNVRVVRKSVGVQSSGKANACSA